ncbi:MAG: DUF4345 domain-containing protein [Bacteroidia bacterium]|nr:DUF4345 domain-containing protein [Bacteroidia bacterium]
MKNQKFIRIASRVFIVFSILSLSAVSLLSLYDPQATMDLVQVQLGNTDAASSIRGVYGGVGLSITAALIYLLLHDNRLGLAFLTLFWGMYALSRLITIFADGALGAFGTQWILTESILCATGLLLLLLFRRSKA